MKKGNTQKELEGTTRADRVAGGSTVDVLEKLYAPKKYFNLSAGARTWYRYLGGLLLETKKLTEIDLPNLALLAESWSQWAGAMQKINDLNEQQEFSGYVQTFKNQSTNVTGYYTVMRNAEASIIKLSGLFGMNFKDRNGMMAFFDDGTRQLNMFDEFNKMHPDNQSANMKVVGGE